jgi:hypothetical protein
MNIKQITDIANNYTDEVFSTTVCIDFANEAIAKINVALGANLPYFVFVQGTTNSNDYTALKEEWIRTVIIPYVSYSIKLNDGSLQESTSNFIQRYQQGLKDLKKNKYSAISEDYRNTNFGGIVKMPKLGTFESYDDADQVDYNIISSKGLFED